jgi:aspartate/methionine/tyrosine aminotransferase
MGELKSNLDYGIFAPIQEAASIALDHAEEITDRLREIFKERHEVISTGLVELGWEIAPSNGGMFVWAKYPSEMDDRAFAFKAIDEVGVVMVPGSVFGTEGAGFVRIALIQDAAELKLAVEKLRKINYQNENKGQPS